MALEPLSPREIQARVRAGASPEVVAAETGWPLDRVERYAGPPLAERGYVADQARAAEVRRTRGPVTLDDTVADAMAKAGRSANEVTWDAWRREDGTWVVTATAPGAVATWTYDLTGRRVHPLDDSARRLMGADVAPTATPAPEERPRLVSVPDQAPESTEPPVSTRATDRETVALARPESTPEPEPAPPAPARTPAPTPAPAKRGKARRASVPSWDEILFGSPRDDDA